VVAESLPNKSLIEIQDNGLYNERVSITKRGVTVRGKKGVWPIITSVGETTNFPVLVNVTAERTILEGLLLIHSAPAGNTSTSLELSGSTRVRSSVIYGGEHAFRGGGDFENCVLFGGCAQGPHVTVRNSICMTEIMYLFGGGEFENVLICGPQRLTHAQTGSCEFRRRTMTGHLALAGEPNLVVDSVVPSVESSRPNTRIEHCDVYGRPPFADLAKPGKGCFGANPQFVDPKNLDYRLMPTSPCTGKASDGGDVGCRYTPEMIEMCKIALELRAKGIVKF